MKSTFVTLILLAIPAFSQQQDRLTPRPNILSAFGVGNSIVTHIADGGGWKTTLTLVNISAVSPAVYVLNLYSDSGYPQLFSFQGIGSKSRITGTLGPGASTIIQTSGVGSTVQGWGELEYPTTSDPVAGFAVFSNTNGNEAAVPFETILSQDSILTFDNTNGFGMGVALANCDPDTMTITATIKDNTGAVLGTDTIIMPAKAHTSFIFAQKWPFTANKQGSVLLETADSGGPHAFGLGILGLRFTPKGAFTSVNSFQQWTLDSNTAAVPPEIRSKY